MKYEYKECFDYVPTITSAITSDGIKWSIVGDTKVTKKDVRKEIKHVIYNPPATIIQWNDGTKTIVKTSENDGYDPIFGYLMAYFQKHSGLTKTQVGKLCDKIIEDFNEQQLKKNKNNNVKIKDEFTEKYWK